MHNEEQDQQQPNAPLISLPISWHFPENLQSRYATNVIVQPGQFEIIISFFEAKVPLILGQPEENKAKLKQLGSIQADCVSKIIVSPELIPTIISALQAGLDSYHASKSNLQREAGSE